MLEYLYNPDMWAWKWTFKSISIQSWILPLAVALLTRHLKRKDHRRIIAFACYSLLMEHCTSNDRLAHLFHDKTNSGWYHLLTPGLFFLMTRLFADYIKKGKYGWLQWVMPVCFTLFAVVNALWIDGFVKFPSSTVGLYSMTGIFLAIGYFLNLLHRSDIFYLEREPMFWIGAGLMIYYSGNFLIWIGISFLNYDASFFASIYRISLGLTIFLNLFFVTAVLLNPVEDTNKSYR